MYYYVNCNDFNSFGSWVFFKGQQYYFTSPQVIFSFWILKKVSNWTCFFFILKAEMGITGGTISLVSILNYLSHAKPFFSGGTNRKKAVRRLVTDKNSVHVKNDFYSINNGPVHLLYSYVDLLL